MLDFSFFEAVMAGLFLAIIFVVAYAVTSELRTQRTAKPNRQLESHLPDIRSPIDNAIHRRDIAGHGAAANQEVPRSSHERSSEYRETIG